MEYNSNSNEFFNKAIDKEYFSDNFLNSKFKSEALESLSIKSYLFSGFHNNVYKTKKDCEIKRKMYDSEPIAFEETSFSYFINEDGFRGKSFKKFDNKNINVLFLGCSVTSGVGLPEEQTWYKKLIKKIENDYPEKKIDYYNLSVSGAGYEIIFKNMLTFIKNIGKPDFIFCLLPQISRQLVWDGEKYMSVHIKLSELDIYGPEWFIKAVSPLPKKSDHLRDLEIEYTKNYSSENSLMRFCTTIHFAEMLCNAFNIKFIWSTWFEDHEKIFENKKIQFQNYFKLKVNFKEMFYPDKKILGNVYPLWIYRLDPNFLSQDKIEKEESIKKSFLDSLNINNEPYWTSARDGWHPGSYTHNVISDKFYKELKSRYNYYMEDIHGK